MEGAAWPFSFAVHGYGQNRVVLALSESRVDVDARSLLTLLEARLEKELRDIYAADLLWAVACAQYKEFHAEAPSEKWLKKDRRQDERTGDQVIADLMDRLKR